LLKPAALFLACQDRGQVASSCEKSYEISGSIEAENFLLREQLLGAQEGLCSVEPVEFIFVKLKVCNFGTDNSYEKNSLSDVT
jgi:hypothetical protein